MEFSANQIAQLLDGTVEGNGDIKVNNLSKIEESAPNTLSFLANPKYAEYIYATKASIVIVANTFVAEKAIPSTCALIRVKDPYSCFALLLEKYNQSKNNKTGISESAKIDSTASIGSDCYIGDFVSVGTNTTIGNNVKLYAGCVIGDNVTLGSNSIIFSNSVIYSDCILGESCTIHSGVIIGSDGFGFAPSSDQEYTKVPQIGNVIIESHVEIGANTCIDRATLGSTIIRKGVKLDNLIQIAHNVEIGEHTVIAGQTGIAGSTKIGSNCLIGGQVGIVGHITIANNVKIAAQSGVQNSIDVDGTIVQGSPAFAIGDYKRSYVLFRSLPRIKSRLDIIEKEIKNSK
ncbi:MAG: UDP-3-O-(3-hydroxymyristoyl)glucosamine N-acyltransferase [Crocinitomicaceae bacterium]|jgi:UDP-3-O-[3-hydroxymyristoyl] glucosamine N-acyltransferase|nr:UDP-3-O-(3-hydroxymyristoyl)glucosamine N-acyltransferase [Crocinitomicaceae bacterium]MBT5402802.1 UDP-3-O-(3-hydroxymyristoyl)glucosamine N-acyltransferase [Crocinitomicaceae bacterium]MBT6029904.1 UDP-3-O-(3-hydroxymyristoyl)glucosamine N-acyltransferase [Crocinitomicaceae bacterium]MBT6513359.1 UDP-3-O-(3-hydroxymyristoyl)glucosamine N-acyltransferase [Crocinitomicaceae bacterium]